MPFNGNGTFVLPGPPLEPGEIVSADEHNELRDDMATGFTDCVTRDGQSPAVANLPMGTYKHTNVGASNSLTNYARTDQVQNDSFNWLTSVSGTNTITAASGVAPAAYAAGQRFAFIPSAVNTDPVTININSLGAKSIKLNGNDDLYAGFLNPGTVYTIVYDGTAFQVALANNSGVFYVERFSGDGSETEFTLTRSAINKNYLLVYIYGVYQQKDTYNFSGTTLTFTTAPPLGTDNIEVVISSTLAIGETDASAVTYTLPATGAVTTNVEAKLAQSVSVKDFGAVGDGVTDDTAAFNECPQGTVYIPEGTYLLSGFVPKDNTLYVGTNNTFLQLNSTSSPICDISDGAQNITFKNINFIGDPTTAWGACEIFDSNAYPYENNISWEDCNFSDFGGGAIACGGLKKGKISNCYFTKTGQLNISGGTTSYPAVWLSDAGSSGSVTWTEASDVTVTNCTFYDLAWSAISALGTRLIIDSNHIKDTVESCIFISPAGSYITISNNIFDTTVIGLISASAIEIGGSFCSATGNTISNAELYGISVQDCVYFSVVGNIIDNCQTGIALITSGSTSTPPRYGTVTGNTVTGSEYGIRFYQAGLGTLIQDCYVRGNMVSESSIADQDFNSSAAIAGYNVRLDDNTALTTPTINTIAFSAKSTGVQVLFSLPFRPRMIRFDSVLNGNTAGFSNSTGIATFLANSSGTVFEKCISSTSNGSTIGAGGSIFVYTSNFSSAHLAMNVVNAVYNQTTRLWNINVNITINDGSDVWTIYTATP